ncbi:MAG: Gmad2 immunoglobulin-like domain-containing protein, partial [Nocardioides sp.]
GPVHPGPSGHHTAPVSSPTAPTSAPTSTSATPSGVRAYAVYYVGQDPSGRPVLFREFHSGPSSTPAGALAVQGLESHPFDPDYTTAWRPGYLRDAKANPTQGVIFVTPGASLPQDRPAGMTAAYAEAAVQQVVYTAQAAFGSRLPVQFIRHGHPVDRVFGVSTTDPIAQGKVLETLSLVNISNPNEGAQVSGRLKVTGVNNAFEGTSVIYLERNGKKYLTTPTIGGMGGNRLYPWTVTLDLSKVAPGQYTLVAQNDDPSGQGHPDVDTRTIEVK